MTFSLLNRRTHVYLGMVLLPWVLVYALSSLVFSHLPTLQRWYGGTGGWQVALEQPCDIPVPEGADLRTVGARILRDLELEGPFFAGRQASQVNILLVDFWERARVTYHVDRQMVVLERMEPAWYQLLIGFHLRSGYGHDHFLSDVWAFVLDLVCLGFLLWAASGIYMWWHIPRHRLAGLATMAAGMAAFWFFMAAL